ncbi:outer membrane beta-barrel protein [Natronoflexus pectinivorans]|uniref:Outer membrane protein with beta-barrel domain n=1 Tax=Natronoflexus pectinivorans TaxID=682526 RepID=A0A4R2GM93_9BACT|nr:outer membrane beta-barrel protein [Natronoflexus pectinivorans]TCO09828.1 outer membrane protein with beta-barrel domain [Natronoflexus pectinivorans]
MNRLYLAILFLSVIGCLESHAQVTDVRPAGFDVIVKTNGEIVYGKVIEVSRTQELVRYKRTDIPDGPVYELFWDEIYAISYRNQLTEYFVENEHETFRSPVRWPFGRSAVVEPTTDSDETLWFSEIDNGELRIGFGLLRQYSKVSEIDDYRDRTGFPSMAITYLFPFRENIELGTSISWASFKYSDRTLSEYDQLLTQRDITETLFTFALVGRYYIDMDLFRPYLLTGLGYTNSSVRTDGLITFTDDERSVLVQGGARSGSFGVPLRAGFDVRLSEKAGAYVDIGTGLTLLQIGGVFKIGK